jgi:hypothetical protein
MSSEASLARKQGPRRTVEILDVLEEVPTPVRDNDLTA